MSLQTLQTWLNTENKNFEEGVKLYELYKITKKHDQFFKAAISAGPTSLHFKILITQLQKAVYRLKTNQQEENKSAQQTKVSQPVAPEFTQISGKKSVRIDDNPYIRVEDLPEDLQLKYKENKTLYKDMAGIHAEMKQAKTNQERKELAEKLKQVEEKQTANWKKIDTWYKNNKNSDLITPSSSEIKQVLAWQKKLERNEKTNIKRWEEKLEKAKQKGYTRQIQRAEAKLKHYKEESEKLRKAIEEKKS